MVLFFGRVTHDKGVLTVLEAWKQLALDPSRAVLVVAGDAASAGDGVLGAPGSGPGEDPDIALALDALPSGSFIRLMGQDDVTPFLQAADLVVVPSWIQEGFGRTIVEALLSGVPAIGCDHGGTAEILCGDLARFTGPPRDSRALTDRIVGLLDWREIEPDLGSAARASIVRRFSYEEHVNRVAAVLLEVTTRTQARVRDI